MKNEHKAERNRYINGQTLEYEYMARRAQILNEIERTERKKK